MNSATAFSRLCGASILLALLVASCLGQEADAEREEADAQPKEPLAKFITLTSPVDDKLSGRVKTAAITLQNQAAQERRRAVLVLQITPGSSQFHQAEHLARFLAGSELSKVTTVAWVPESVKGNNVVLALGCKEIVMHPDAELGDIGRGKPLDQVNQQLVMSLIERRHNRMLNPALARGMMDPQQVVLKIQKQVGPPEGQETETQIVTHEELKRLVETGAIVLKRDTILDAGDTTFTGSKARALEVLVVQTAQSVGEIAEAYNLPREALREVAADGGAFQAQLIEIHGTIDPLLATFVKRQISRAVDAGANLLIFEIESPGGYLQTSQELADTISYLDPKKVRTVAYVPKEAISGAAIVALGCDEIYLHPAAMIGDAGPIEIGEGQVFERAPEKILSLLREILRELAERKNRPPALAMAMADRNLKVYQVTHRESGREWYMSQDEIDASDGEWLRGPLVPESRDENLLTVDGERAHALKLAEPPVADIDELKSLLGVPPEVALVAAERTWVDTLIFILNSNAALGLLVVIGVICLFAEVHLMTGLLGIISALCFSLVFWSRFMGGTAGWLEIMLFVLGLACIGMEIFVIPGFGVFGVSGGLMLLSSLILASHTFEIEMGHGTRSDGLAEIVGTLSASIVAIVVLMLALNKFLPKIPVFGKMILSPPGHSDMLELDEPRLHPTYVKAAVDSTPGTLRSLIGSQGETISILRPAGKADFAGRFVDVVSNGAYIEKGRKVEVMEVLGNRVVVREV